ncbi:MAG: EAL domain-containing protein [Oscillospiraceae bacterium]
MPNLQTVLIVDDSELNRVILKGILSDSYCVIEAENGKDALDILKETDKKISIIMLDLVMPIMDGYEFLTIMSKLDEFSNIPIIVSTGNSGTENEIKVLKLGAWDFVTKPYNAEIIKFRIKNAIYRSQLSAFEQLKYLAEFDELTGIYNKNKFFKETHEMLIKNPNDSFIFLRVDIDRFNLINSFYGVTEGDNLLKYIAENIKKIALNYEKCTFGRIEADIFGLCTSYSREEKIIEGIEAAKNLFKEYNSNYDILPSFGLYAITNHELPVNVIFDRANLATKQIKGNYIKSYAFYNEEMSANIEREQEIINDMCGALEKQQFTIYLQPKYNLQTNAIAGAEALVRWIHPQKGIISPVDFIPIFERNGFISKLDFFVWETVCLLIRKWLDQGKNPYPVSVNVSRVNLYNPNFVDIICNLTDKHNIPHNLFNLELTESAYTDNPIVMQETMSILKKKGFVIMMDDFGSGYSSLNILKDIDVDVLKIDMRFLTQTSIPGRGENIIASVVRMAKWLNITTIVEGAEKSEQVEFLRGIGCEYIQGFYFARPMPIAEYEKFIESHEHYENKNETEKEIEKEEKFDANSLWISNPQMEVLFSSVMQSVAICEYENGKIEILRVNKAFYDLFGSDGMTIKSDDPIKSVNKEYQGAFFKAFEDAVESRDTAECDYIRTFANGNNVWINIKLKYINKVGNKYILFGTFRDITQEKSINSELEKYRKAISSSNTETNKLMIIDSIQANRTTLKSIFEDDFTIIEAQNSEEAIEILNNNNKIDIILIDIMVPDVEPIDFLKHKKFDAKISDIPVITITSDDSLEQQVNALSLGANDYIVKPFIKEIVIRRVNNVLESNRRLKEILNNYNSAVEFSKADMLTSVYNRTTGEALVTNILNVKSQRVHALIVIDIDNFKAINDTLGYNYGDRILTEIATLLKKAFRCNDIIFRTGGDEFCILMTNIPTTKTVYTKCCELCQQINLLEFDDGTLNISCSIGIAETSNEYENFENLYKNANEALYKSKKAGKNMVCVFGEEIMSQPINQWFDNQHFIDALDCPIFIIDYENYDILYMSKAGIHFCGINNYNGHKCFELFYNRKSPCDNCIYNKLSYDKYYEYIRKNENLNKKILIKDKLIDFGGRKAHLQLAVDVTNMD